MGDRGSLGDGDLFGEGPDKEIPAKNHAVEKRRKRFKRSDEYEEEQNINDEDLTDSTICNGFDCPDASDDRSCVDKKAGILRHNQTPRPSTGKPLVRSVSFQNDDDDGITMRNKDGQDDDTKARRESWRRSSGYGTGSGSKHSQQSSDSSMSNISHVFSDSQESDVTSGELSTFSKQDSEVSIANQVNDTSVSSPRKDDEKIPYLSIFDQENFKLSLVCNDQSGIIPNLSIFEAHERVCEMVKSTSDYDNSDQGNLPMLSVFKERLSSITERPTSALTEPVACPGNCGNLPCLSFLDNAKIKTGYKDIDKNTSKSTNSTANTADDSSVDISFHEQQECTPSIRYVQEHYCDYNEPNSTISRHFSGSSNSPSTNDFWCFIKNDRAFCDQYYRDPAMWHQLISLILQSPSPKFSPHNGFNASATPTMILQQQIRDSLFACSRCKVTSCPDKLCNQIKMRMLLVDKALKGEFTVESSPEVKQMIQILSAHSERCQEPRFKCPVKFCHIFHCVDEGFDATHLLKIHTVSLMTMGEFYTTDMDKGHFYELSHAYPENSFPDRDTTIPIMQFGDYGNVTLFCLENGQNYILKKVPKLDREDEAADCLKVYVCLRNRCHHGIVPHMWIHDTADAIFICTLFCQGGTLDEHLDQKSFLLLDEAVMLMRQILEAVIFLHQKSIIYLYWSASNILFKNASRRTIQLSNLSMSVMSGEKFDVGYLKTSLPPSIISPELIDADGNDLLTLKADSWGLGGLFAEMLTGMQMWHDDRHSDREVIFSKIKSGQKPELTQKQMEKIENEHLIQLLKCCWELNPSDRIEAGQVLDSLKNNRR